MNTSARFFAATAILLALGGPARSAHNAKLMTTEQVKRSMGGLPHASQASDRGHSGAGVRAVEKANNAAWSTLESSRIWFGRARYVRGVGHVKRFTTGGLSVLAVKHPIEGNAVRVRQRTQNGGHEVMSVSLDPRRKNELHTQLRQHIVSGHDPDTAMHTMILSTLTEQSAGSPHRMYPDRGFFATGTEVNQVQVNGVGQRTTTQYTAHRSGGSSPDPKSVETLHDGKWVAQP